jgi:Ras-related protein Rab-7A
LHIRFATGRFSGLRRPTVGADFLSKKIEIHDVEVSLQIWDTAGQERFHQGSLGNSFYRGAHGALLVYDVNNADSIEQIVQWRDECLQHQEGDNYFPLVVIGNKVDLRELAKPEDRIDQRDILTWCQDQSYGHIETSAKDGLGVEAAMIAITGLALEAKRTALRNTAMSSLSSNNSTIRGSTSEKVRLNSLYEPKKKGFCEGCA